MAPSKMEERMGFMEEQMMGVHDSLLWVQGELQKLLSLDSSVGTLMSKLALFDHFELAFQQLDAQFCVGEPRPSAATSPISAASPSRTVTGRFESHSDPPRSDFCPSLLEMPTFDGQNPDGWVFRAEHFFLS
ncbi:hypothetical protein PanWU01x14_175160 [Parasponia andersonii]|uniref:Uncharacterized protein n=1 Tax=Parasponia andersonii TaxID=3476 RepID=A0A2P5C868_PARAD|nr:hypothetical protein PanWU01x14_175160 [Parasponia andersonii]